MTMSMNLLAYRGVAPVLAAPPLRFSPTAAVIGRATIGPDAWLADCAVIRADGHDVRAGAELMLGARTTVHIAHDVYPTLIGHRVTVGAYAVIHACTVGDDCVIEDGAVVLDGCVLEPGLVLASGSIVYPRTTLAGGYVYSGRPAKPQRRLEAGELDRHRQRLRERIRTADSAAPAGGAQSDFDAGVFIANTATLRGRIRAAAQAQVYYACDLDAGSGEIVLGARSNVQDNSLLRAGKGRIEIGADSTIGHNVRMAACTIGSRSLIGIGAVVAEGTVVADDVFLAAGGVTTPGQVLASGFWVGSPARRVGDLDDAKRKIIADTIPTYCAYARELARAQMNVRAAA